MHTDAPVRKAGRLSREDQRRLGDILKRVYDDVLRQGVPDRFRALLDELKVEGGERAASGIHGQAQGEGDPDDDRLVEAKAAGQKGVASNKGSH